LTKKLSRVIIKLRCNFHINTGRARLGRNFDVNIGRAELEQNFGEGYIRTVQQMWNFGNNSAIALGPMSAMEYFDRNGRLEKLPGF
jgi:hypothetical protein